MSVEEMILRKEPFGLSSELQNADYRVKEGELGHGDVLMSGSISTMRSQEVRLRRIPFNLSSKIHAAGRNSVMVTSLSPHSKVA